MAEKGLPSFRFLSYWDAKLIICDRMCFKFSDIFFIKYHFKIVLKCFCFLIYYTNCKYIELNSILRPQSLRVSKLPSFPALHFRASEFPSFRISELPVSELLSLPSASFPSCRNSNFLKFSFKRQFLWNV